MKTINKQYDIKGDQRVFICGKTRSGKTTLAKYLLYPAKHLIVIDGKDQPDLRDNWNLEEYSKKHLNDIREHKPFRIRLVNNAEDILTVLNYAYEYGSCIIYIDEVTATIPPQTKPLSIYTDIWTRGAGRNIGGWANTQRPTQIPLIFLSEAEHYFMFRLNLETDRKRVGELFGTKVPLIPHDTNGFYYYNLNEHKLTYYRRLNI